jgi:hypothetical protein
VARSLQPLRAQAASRVPSNREDKGFMVIPFRYGECGVVQACASVRSSAGISAGISRAR